MANKNWPKIIRGLKRLVRDNGPVWPEPSTKLAGYAEDGPYRCGNCEYLLGIDKMISEGHTIELVNKRRGFAASHTWENCVGQLDNILINTNN